MPYKAFQGLGNSDLRIPYGIKTSKKFIIEHQIFPKEKQKHFLAWNCHFWNPQCRKALHRGMDCSPGPLWRAYGTKNCRFDYSRYKYLHGIREQILYRNWGSTHIVHMNHYACYAWRKAFALPTPNITSHLGWFKCCSSFFDMLLHWCLSMQDTQIRMF